MPAGSMPAWAASSRTVVTTSRPALSSECRTTIFLPMSACLSRSRAKNASPADRQDGPSRKNQSRPASVRKVAGLSALTNGISKRSERWLAYSVTCGSYAPTSALTLSLETSWLTARPAITCALSPAVSAVMIFTLASPMPGMPDPLANGSGIGRVEPVDHVRGELRAALCLDAGRAGRALQRRQQADLELLAAGGRLGVVPGAAAGGDRQRDGEDQGQATAPDDHDGRVLRDGDGGGARPPRAGAGTSAGYPVTRDTGLSMTYGDRAVAERRFASPAVHAGTSGGPIVPEKYPETASARGKVARAGGETTRGACCPGRTVRGGPVGTGPASGGACRPAPARGRPPTAPRPGRPARASAGAAARLRAPAERPARTWSGFSPRHWRVRSKLIAVLVVPAVAFLVLASFNMAGQIGSAREFGRGATIAEFGRQVTVLTQELQAERDLAAGYISGGRQPSNQAAINKANADNEKIARGQREAGRDAEAARSTSRPRPRSSRCRPSSATWTPR